MKTILILSLSLVLSASSFAKPKNSGFYWVIETNMNDKSYTIVRFYNANHDLVNEKVIEGYFMSVRKAKDRRKLNRSLKNFTEEYEWPVLDSVKKPILAVNTN
ncbi:hypothetical protein [Marivirga sp.]|uniref:hypothetical protein n=1 Tax=Marivirga sp. TaxID=2018662 RepID=UPI002D80FDBF|nr:hypothetical protein [Marivirga sp.]HET8861573.1 hypothetical protein [Marivirga sp.]